MFLELLIPGMQNREEADLGIQALGIRSDLEQCCRARSQQQRVGDSLVLQGQLREDARHSEDDMQVAHRQQLAATVLEPTLASVGLTLRTMPIATRVVGDGRTVAAVAALIEMSTERSGAATLDRGEHLQMSPAEPTAMVREELLSRDANQIGHLQWRPWHLLRSALSVVRGVQLQRVQRTGDGMEVPRRQMQIQGGLLEITVSEQDLDGAQVRPILE